MMGGHRYNKKKSFKILSNVVFSIFSGRGFRYFKMQCQPYLAKYYIFYCMSVHIRNCIKY